VIPMTIVIGWPAIDVFVGFLLGVVVILFTLILFVSFGHWQIRIGWITPARAAGFRRAFKLVFFPVVGAVLTNGAGWVVSLLTSVHVPVDIASASGVLVGAALGGVHQGVTWIDVPPVVPVAPPVVTPVLTSTEGE